MMHAPHGSRAIVLARTNALATTSRRLLLRWCTTASVPRQSRRPWLVYFVGLWIFAWFPGRVGTSWNLTLRYRVSGGARLA